MLTAIHQYKKHIDKKLYLTRFVMFIYIKSIILNTLKLLKIYSYSYEFFHATMIK